MKFRNDLSPLAGLEQVIGDIYEVAFSAEGMPRLLEVTCAALGSQSAVLCLREADGRGMEESWGIDPAFDGPMAHFMHQNLLAQRMHLVGVDDPIRDTDLVRREEWRGLELYEEVWKPAGLHQCLGVIFAREGGGTSSLGFFRPGEDGGYGEQARRIAGILSPHLRRAMRLRATFVGAQRRSQLFEGALDTLALPLLVISASGRIVHLNRAGEDALNASAQLIVSFGRLGARQPSDRSRLNALLSGLKHGVGGSAALGVASRNETRLLASPLPEAAAAGLGHTQTEKLSLIVLQAEAGKFEADGTLLRSLFDLSPAETELALAMGRGLTLAQFSDARGVSLNTSRTQLKALFAKTGVSRQSDLVRLVAGLGVVRG